MVTYFVDRRHMPQQMWANIFGPLSTISEAIRMAANSVHGPTAELHLRAISTELQPDGTIIRRELTPEELAAAIRGEQVEPNPVKAVVVVWDRMAAHEAVYIDGTLWMATDLSNYDAIGASGFETIADGQPITVKSVMVDRAIDDWPAELASLELD